ncbi:hypothetical protein ACF07B_26135 [Streptomyces sp. NPDC015532]|uniref:hypothetical protein n=1 Tax=Streptomyces sp. NPDC015532 TaxID=3364960 RepID=UPI0036FE5766
MTNSQLSSLEVIGLADDQLAKANKYYKWSRRLPIATFILSIVSIFISNPYTYIPAALALAVQVSSWLARDKASSLHSAGEEGRTHGLSLNALGTPEERLELNKWLSRVTPRVPSQTTDPAASDYYASNSPIGLRRLCDNLQENSFWNAHQYQKTATHYIRLLWIFAGATIAVTLAAIPLTSGDGNLVLARILVALLASGAALTQLSEVRSWKSAEAKSERLDIRLDALASFSEDELREKKLGTILAIFGDYRVTTASAPPIPKWMYLREKDRLNDLWARRSDAS